MPAEHTEHHIVIVPGFSVTSRACRRLAQWCTRQGMVSHVFTYPLREWSVDRAALMLATFVDIDVLERDASSARSVSFIACEYGTLVTRYFLSHYDLPSARRCVLITDPWHPMDAYREKEIGFWGRLRYGAPLKQVAEGPHGFPSNCDCPPVPFGVIVTHTTDDAKAREQQEKLVRGSVFASPFLLRHAQDVMYALPPCQRAIHMSEIRECIAAFLLHGWFSDA